MNGCIFCKIAYGDIKSHTVYEDDTVIVFMDLAPAGKGHCLIVPKAHADDIYDLDPKTAGHIFQLAVKLAAAIKNALHCDGLNVLQNNGTAAGQTVRHFHMHLIPRYESESECLNFFEEHAQVDSEELAETARRIREAL